MVFSRALGAVLACTSSLLTAQPAQACLSCSCGGSGTAADLGAAGGAASFFGMGSRWLLQQGLSLRSITGSFNERGALSPMPQDAGLLTAQGTFALNYFPAPGVSLGLQAPLIGHGLNRAAWGMFGSVEATDVPWRTGGGLGDLVLQGSATLWEWPWGALAAWGSSSAPTGTATGEAQTLTGQGFWTAGAGLVTVWQWEGWEATLNAGHQRPIGTPAQANPFSLGPVWLYQAHLNYSVHEKLRLGFGLNGLMGVWEAPVGGQSQPTAKVKVVGTSQLALSPVNGLRLALGFDPERVGAQNALQDVTLYVIGYQYLP